MKQSMLNTVFLTACVLASHSSANPLPTANATFPAVNIDEIQLGQLLFYDPILSGNKSVSCATCHHPRFATSDGVSLGLGDGGMGLGPERTADKNNTPEQRIPRNAPALFNLGASEFSVLFHDGRLEKDPNEPGGFRTPLGQDMEPGFDSVLSAQTMFPVLSPDEMAGHYTENEVSKAIRQGLFTGPNGAWDLLTRRVIALKDYSQRFEQVLGPDEEVHFSDISNAIAAFMAFEWRADNSPFDQYLRGQFDLTPDQSAGMALFYGDAQCATCHAGQFQTDHGFHALGMPQIGPGKAARFERHQKDEGRLRVTGQANDAYKFRTPSLRNVTHTAPYGHAGAFATLNGVILHHATPDHSLRTYEKNQAVFPDFSASNDFDLMQNDREVAAISQAISITPQPLSASDIAHLIDFLHTLSDETSLKGRLGIPKTVPSGLPIDR